MQLALARVLSAGLAALPLAWNRRVGALLGRLAWMADGRAPRATRLNLALAFPDMAPAARETLARASLIEAGKNLTEIAWVWRRPLADIEPEVREVVGRELYDEARAGTRGTLLATPHFGNWELCPRVGADEVPMNCFYRPPRRLALEPLLLEGRANLRSRMLRLDGGGIRDALRRLAANEIVGILPDQEPDRAGGVFAPLFGEPALTTTLFSRIAAKSGARVLFIVNERLPGGGWRLHYLPAEEGIADRDPLVAATALNRSIERCIRSRPEQYLWSYRRFRELEGGGRRAGY